MESNELADLIAVWKVLEMLTVSLDRIGTYEYRYGEDAGKNALDQFMNPKGVQKISSARMILKEFMQQHDPNMRDRLEILAENEEDIGYWNGPVSNNSSE
jgi:hypothetical protein